MPNELDREIAARQKYCYSCGRGLKNVKYECPICGEFSCSEECRDKHIAAMDKI